MAKYKDIMIKENACSCRGLSGDVTSPMRSLTSAEVGRLPAGMELTLELENNSTADLLLPACTRSGRRPHAENGTAFVLADFGLGGEESIAERLLAAGRMTILRVPRPVDLEVKAALYIANGQFSLGALLWEETARQVAHYRAFGVDHLASALLVVEAGGNGSGS